MAVELRLVPRRRHIRADIICQSSRSLQRAAPCDGNCAATDERPSATAGNALAPAVVPDGPLSTLMSSYAFNQYALPLLVTSLAVLFLGVLTLAQERGSRVAGPFVLMSLTLAVWSFGMGAMYLSGSEETASLWAKLGHVGLIFFPTAAYHFTLRVLDRRTRDPILLTGIAGSLFFLPALASDAFLREFQLYGWGYYFGYGPLGTTFVLFFALMLGACMLRYVLALRATKAGSGMHHRAGLLLAALAIGCLCGIDFFAAYRIPVPPLGYLAI